MALDKALKVRGRSVLKVSAQALGERCVHHWLTMASEAWGRPIWEGVWPCLDAMDTVCLRTASMEWNVPGKYGPHGELFFFLIQKEPAAVWGSETFSSFFTADIRTSFFSADVIKK